MTAAQPIKVAIVGGGCAGITTAFELSRPEHQGRYQVTVYQQGWRLGGKGASGRGPAGRIQEHGLHLWMGHYDNAFHLMRQCYAELDRDPASCPIASWTDAFVPDPYVGVTDQGPDGVWRRLMAEFPSFPGLPGDPYPEGVPTTVVGYLNQAARLLVTLIDSALQGRIDPADAAESISSARMSWHKRPVSDQSVGGRTDMIRRILAYGELTTLTALIQAVAVLEMITPMLPGLPHQLLTRYLDAISTGARDLLQPLLDEHPESRYIWEIIDLVLAAMRGCIRFGLAMDPRGFDAINEYDAREWLLLNGASERSVNNGFMRGLYDLALAYEEGDPNRPGMAAGQGLRGCFRMLFSYRGALFWKMQAGMGDVVFAPFYQVLEQRGVRFEFFHRLENVGLVAAEKVEPGERAYVERLEFDVQAHIREGSYQPLVDIHGLPCWPADPLWSQLADGDALRLEGRDFECYWDQRCVEKKTLKVTRDFDVLVLAVGGGAVPYLCREILERDSRWRTMAETNKTVATQAFQIWMKEDMGAFGWDEPAPNISGFVEPFDTWADMSHLAGAEDWPTTPKAIAYFCNALACPGQIADRSDTDFPDRQRAIVKENALRFLREHIVALWPEALDENGDFRWDLLASPDGGDDTAGAARFDKQFWIANVSPSERYVLALPGTLKNRISPLDNTYDNMTVAGDWTDCGFNFGCVEAAVMSGRLAAHSISFDPPLDEIFGFNHP